jgi:hypothetical protein
LPRKYLKYKRNNPNSAPLAFLPAGFSCAIHTPPRGVIARTLQAITPLIENQMVVRKALHEPVSVRNRTSLRTATGKLKK